MHQDLIEPEPNDFYARVHMLGCQSLILFTKYHRLREIDHRQIVMSSAAQSETTSTNKSRED